MTNEDSMRWNPTDVSVSPVSIVRLNVGTITIDLAVEEAHALACAINRVIDVYAKESEKSGESTIIVTQSRYPTVVYHEGESPRRSKMVEVTESFRTDESEVMITVGDREFGPISPWTAAEIADELLDVPEVSEIADVEVAIQGAF